MNFIEVLNILMTSSPLSVLFQWKIIVILRCACRSPLSSLPPASHTRKITGRGIRLKIRDKARICCGSILGKSLKII